MTLTRRKSSLPKELSDLNDAHPEKKQPAAKAGGAGVQSLRRAMDILVAVADARSGLSLAEISKRVGLHTSTTFHLAKTLVMVDLLRQDKETKAYKIGSVIFSLAAGALHNIELLDISKPHLEQLALRSGESSHVAIWAGDDVVIIGKHDAPGSIQLSERVGIARPAYATATGKALLSAYSDEQISHYIQSHSFTPFTTKTVTDPEKFRASLEAVREMGVAFDDGELDLELRCLASPVYDFRGQIIAAIGIAAPAFRLSLNRIENVSAMVKETARDLSARLGAAKLQI